MAVEKAKVITALTAKLAGKNVSKQLIDRYSTRYAEKIATDEEIDGFIDDRFEDVIDAQKEGDRRATAKPNPDPNPTPAPKPEPPNDDPDTPAWAKALIEQNRTLSETVAGLKQESSQKSIADRIKSDPRTKDLPSAWLEDRVMPTAENFDAWADKTQATFKTFATDAKLQTFGNDTPGGSTAKGGSVQKEASKDQLDALMDTMKL